MSKKPEYFYKVTRIVKVVDGDTVDAEVDTGFHHRCTQRFRLSSIDTPERGQEGFTEAKDELRRILEFYAPKGRLFVESEDTGSFGRWLGTFYFRDELDDLNNVNKIMVDNGFAKPY